MKFILTLVFMIPVNSTTHLDLIATRLRQLDPTGKRRNAALLFSPVLESYNKVVSVPRDPKPTYDIYNAILYTVLCGISTGSTSNTPGNHCRELTGAELKTGEAVLRQIFSIAYKDADYPVVPIDNLDETRPSHIGPRSYADRDALIKQKLTANGGIPPSPVKFDDISKVWNGLVRGSPTIPDNNSIIYGLMILNDTGKSLPITPEQRDEIISQFCIIFQGQPLYKYRSDLVEECRDFAQPTREEIDAAKTELKKALKPKRRLPTKPLKH